MTTKELLLEIGVEEIPAGFIEGALENLKSLMAARLDEYALDYSTISTAATPRRLAICVKGVASRQPDRSEDFIGPSVKAAFDGEHNPTKAAIGFAASKGASVDDLQIVSTTKGEYVKLSIERQGEPAEELFSRVLPEIILELPFPKSMRWGSGRTVFVRPIQWILALFGGSIVPFNIDDVKSGVTTHGHRFMAPGEIPVKDYVQYVSDLRKNHVLVDPQERRKTVIQEVNRALSEAVGGNKGTILEDEELIDTVNNLVEYPHGVCGSFDDKFLVLPKSVLITAMREHQKYFSVADLNGDLIAKFVAVNNTHIKNRDLATEGHQRVLRARLEDALFFLNDDQNSRLEERVDGLAGLIFQNKLGNMLEKTERMVQLTGMMAKDIEPEVAAIAQRAAFLAKADLLTAMVNEFPSLQGTIGKDYALLNGEEESVANAIKEHYLPVRAGGEIPSEVPGALVGLADRIDTIVGCFGLGQIPTGTADPFGLRRLALGILHIIEEKDFSVSLSIAVEGSISLYGDKLKIDSKAVKENVLEFIEGRFVNDLAARGITREAIEAVTSVSFDNVVDCHARINALVAIKNQPAFTILAAAFKRVMNIVKQNSSQLVDPAILQEGAEMTLYDSFLDIKIKTQPLLEKKEYGQALELMLSMKEPVDSFFDHVMVMVDDNRLRENRLNLLTGIAELFLRVGDFSKMHLQA